jgi:predicted nucleic acid-binding protein
MNKSKNRIPLKTSDLTHKNHIFEHRMTHFNVKQRIYIDTSVFGGHFDEEFGEHTIPLFDRIKDGEFIILYSTVTQDELENAPEKVKELVKSLKSDLTEFIETTNEAVDLATEYITEKVVGKTSFADCLHIALATINRADFLVSWNFKHIVNIERIRGYNSINIKNGYKQLEIRSPREFEKYEDD